jgi:hypothetical protein
MATNKTLLSIILVLTVLWWNAQAEAKEKKWKGTFSGSYVSTEVDTDGNGEKGSSGTLQGSSTFGAFSEQAIVEPNFTGGTDTTCPSGNSGREYSMVAGTGHFVVRFTNGDLLWGELTSETWCFDYVTSLYSFSGQFSVTGGTGKYQNATSPSPGQFSGQGKHLFVYPPLDVTGRYFGEESGTFEGIVNIP